MNKPNNSLNEANVNTSFQSEQKFYPVNKSKIVIPQDYNHAKQLSSINEEEFVVFNYKLLRDKQFSKTSHILKPQEEYIVSLFPAKHDTSLSECLEFLRSLHCKLVGPQGLSLLWQIARNILPQEVWIYSIDIVEALPQNVIGCHEIAALYHGSGNNHSFELGLFERDYFTKDYFFIGFELV